jgi:hypothetical protein
MIISGGPRRRWASAGFGVLCLSMLAVAGCGSNGTADVKPPPPGQPQQLVTGVVRMPNGELVSTNAFWQWAKSVRLLVPAYATSIQNPSVFPASGVPVTLERVDHVDAADGSIDSPHNLAGSLPTDGSGTYTIDATQAAPTLDGCGFMLFVGGRNQRTLTRAFVLAPLPAATPPEGAATADAATEPVVYVVDVDVVSETVVGVVLNRLTKAPPVGLCDFPLGSPGLQAITDAVSNAVYTATGSDVEEINQTALAMALNNRGVQAAVNAATGVAANN